METATEIIVNQAEIKRRVYIQRVFDGLYPFHHKYFQTVQTFLWNFLFS